MRRRLLTFLLLSLTACGGSGADAGDGRSAIRTLAYVVTECFQDAAGVVQARQRLLVQIGDEEGREIFRSPEIRAELPQVQACVLFGETRFGLGTVTSGFFQRLGVSPDGRRVVFEVTSEFSDLVAFVVGEIDKSREGIYVWTEAGGVRRLWQASRDPSFRFGPAIDGINYITFLSLFVFSPDGRAVTYIDRGPGPGDNEAIQVFVLDLDTGGPPQQVTQLPAGPGDFLAPDTCCPFFLDERRLAFLTVTNPIAMDVSDGYTGYAIDRNGGPLQKAPAPTALASGAIDTSFLITGPEPVATVLTVDGSGAGPPGGSPVILTDGRVLEERISEAFLVDGDNLLQLTNFRFSDMTDAVVSPDRQQAFFNSSVDLGDNPTHTCQLFSKEILSGAVRQLTSFVEVPPNGENVVGCFFDAKPNGCAISNLEIDPITETVVFFSTCDPFGTNDNGSQIFAMKLDGRDLRQVTRARGAFTDEDGNGLELIGPWAYAATQGHRLRPPLVNPKKDP